MSKFFRTPFALSGDKTPIPDTVQGDGSVSYAQGYGVDYERDYDDPLAKDIPRSADNQLRFDITQAIGEIQQNGVASWSEDGKPYPIKALVYHNGSVFSSLTAANNATPVAGADWRDISDALSPSDLLASTGTNETKGMTQKAISDALKTKVSLSGNQTIEGIKTFSSFPVTPSAAPTEEYQAANKKYVDDKSNVLPSMTGSIALNGTTNNTVVMTDIVTELDLEVGDVIRIDAGAYNKLHTVESITDNSSIIVNYEHAGNRANGSLKLPDFTGSATVTRIAKWFNAPIGLGQAWIDMKAGRVANAVYTNTTGRSIVVIIDLDDNIPAYVDGILISYSAAYAVSITVPNMSTYETRGSAALHAWGELR